ncbi:hypothetical protein N665_0629s0029 [Sinapis alba]|nr:hypothetical protein N665_0629s0029 [Sinapis alba]KAF8086318.1 hypothetical protein N665_0629s0029 [Sinapis alba]
MDKVELEHSNICVDDSLRWMSISHSLCSSLFNKIDKSASGKANDVNNVKEDQSLYGQG